MDELVDAQPGVQKGGDDCIWHRSGALGLTPKSLPFDGGKTLRGKRLAGDGFQLCGRVVFDAAGVSSPPIKPLQRRQGGIHRRGLLSCDNSTNGSITGRCARRARGHADAAAGSSGVGLNFAVPSDMTIQAICSPFLVGRTRRVVTKLATLTGALAG